MLAQGCGKIINTASMASLLVPHPQKQAAYNASKAAGRLLLQVVWTAALEWLPGCAAVLVPVVLRTVSAAPHTKANVDNV